MRRLYVNLLAGLLISVSTAAQSTSITLYDQDFESPDGFVNGFSNGGAQGYRDVSQQSVNDLYKDQPVGFSFAQTFTVETILLTGTEAFGTGYDDTSGQGGNYALGMLETLQDDLLGLSFDIGTFAFFNFQIDISSVGLDGPGGPFSTANSVPRFAFTLFDNPSGAPGVPGTGTVLDSGTLTGVASALDVLSWTTGTFAFDASQSTNGNVTLQIDLVEGGYAAFDNFKITASDQACGGINYVSVPATISLFSLGLALIMMRSKRR